MIRDPSDGSVKEINPQANEINEMVNKKASDGIIEKPVLNTATSGLPITKSDEAERLQRAREWLKNYHQ